MTSAIQVSDGWILDRDYAALVGGAGEQPIEAESVFHNLSELARINASAGAKRTSGAIVAKAVRSRVRNREAEELETLRRAVDQLLPLVPRRRGALPQDRLEEIVRQVGRKAQEYSRGEVVFYIAVLDEDDLDSGARHRISVTFVAGRDSEVELVTEAGIALHEYLAGELSRDEFGSVRLVVDIE